MSKQRRDFGTKDKPLEELPTAEKQTSLHAIGQADHRPTEKAPPEALPVGLKEEVPAETDPRKTLLFEGWQRKGNQYINRRDFQTKDGAVPQGVVRSLEEAYALEVQRLG